MAMVNIINCCLESIRQIAEDLEGAAVYLDVGCEESFKFIGAFPLLLELGVHAVCSLENLNSLDVVVDWNPNVDHVRKIVVLTSRFLSDAHRYVLRCLSTHERVGFCIVFTSISETGHSAYPDSPLGPDAFGEYESLLIQDYEELVKRSRPNSRHLNSNELKESTPHGDEGWSQLSGSGEEFSKSDVISSTRDIDDGTHPAVDLGPKLVVSVRHFPLILCPFSPRFFVLPSEGSVAEAHLSAPQENSLSLRLPSLSAGAFSDGEDIPPGAALTAQFIYHLATKMDLKMEIFSLGDLSKIVGKLLTDMSSLYNMGRRKHSAGLLLIDRNLDLLTPCCHGDSLVDRIFSSVPRRSWISSSSKGLQSQLKQDSVKCPALDLQIPLPMILGEEDSKTKKHFLLESIEAFLHGWISGNSSASKINELINLSTKVNGEKSLFLDQLLSGSLVSTENFHGTPYLESILDRRTKDGAMLIKKWLQEILREENISVNGKICPGFPSKSDLQHLIKALAQNQSSLLRNKGIFQLAAAAIVALDESNSARWDAFISSEKMLNISAEDTSQSLAAQISDIINKSASSQGDRSSNTEPSTGLLSFQDALLLTVTGYMLAGENFPTSGSLSPFSWQEEHFLKEAIIDAVLENPDAAKVKFLHGLVEDLQAKQRKDKEKEMHQEPSDLQQINDFDDEQWGSWGDEDDTYTNKEQVYNDVQLKLELRDKVDNLFNFLHKLCSLKKNSPLKGALSWESSSIDSSYSSKGLLYKLLRRLLSKFEVPGLEYHSSTVGRLFKSGFGRFGLGQSKPNLADQNIILVFILGGISAVEFREAQEAMSESGRPATELILGGTTLLTPSDMFDLLLGDSSNF